MSISAVSEKPMINVGLDDGYAAVKLAWYDGEGRLMTFSIPSRARQGSLGVGSLTSDQMVGGYRTEEICFTVAPGLEGEETRFPDYNMSPLARILSHHALVCAGFSGQSVRIASGLPLDRYFKNGKKDEEQVDRKIRNFAQPVVRTDGGELARIVHHEVFAQGLAAALDWFVGSDRKREGEVGVVDIGGQTMDVSVVLPGLLRERVKTYDDVGVLSVHAILKRLIMDIHKVDDVPAENLDRALFSGTIRLWGKDHAVENECEAARLEVWSQIERRIRSVFEKKIASLNAILFVGGGSHLFRDRLALFPNAIIPPDPEFANARGLLKALALSGGKG